MVNKTDKSTIGVLLVNLGTPSSPAPKDVFRYLIEFLTDGRVIDMPWLKRQCLVRGLIVPLRYRQSAKLYQQVWTKEGSPLLVHGRADREKLQESLGPDFKVALAMRYQTPSIKEGLEELRRAQCSQIIILPLFPQYASATTGSVHEKVMEIVRNWDTIPALNFVNSYPEHPKMIDAFCQRAQQYDHGSYDRILFSFHGLPERHLQKADASGKVCLTQECCLQKKNPYCYKAQCVATAHAIASKMGWSADRYSICFQSRLGKDPWIQPYTSQVIQDAAKHGVKRLLVLCPSFVCDCLETTCEISHEYATEFQNAGGQKLDLVEGLNSHPVWIEALHQLVLQNTLASFTPAKNS